MIRYKSFFRQNTYSVLTNDFTGRFLCLQITKCSCVARCGQSRPTILIPFPHKNPLDVIQNFPPNSYEIQTILCFLKNPLNNS